MKDSVDSIACSPVAAVRVRTASSFGDSLASMRSDTRRSGVRFFDFVVSGVFAAAVLAIYGQVGAHRTIAFDDALYLTDNVWVSRGLTWEGVIWAFTNFDAANWHPITWLSHMIDQSLFGDLIGGHMIENPLWHFANVLLFYSLLLRLGFSRGVSVCVALIFACHPLNVESVAWLSQRKSQLATFFLLSSVLLYLEWRATRRTRTLCLMAASFLLSLMSKAAGVGLPIILFALELALCAEIRESVLKFRISHKEHREWLRVIVPRMVPAAIVSLVVCLVTLLAQDKAGAVASLGALSIADRLTNSFAALGIYLKQFLYPSDLCFFYPFAETANTVGAAVGVATFALSVVCILISFRRFPLLFFGFTWFYFFLMPVIGLVQVGSQTHADRYMYLPMMGLLIAVAVCLEWLRNSTTVRRRSLALFGVCGYSSALGVSAYGYVIVWHDPETAYRHAIATCGHSYIMSTNLAATLMNRNYLASAEETARLVAERWPDRPLGVANLASILARQQRFEEAESLARRSIEIEPGNPRYHYLLGLVLVNLQREGEAEMCFQDALRLLPPRGEWRAADRFMRDVLMRKIPVKGAELAEVETEPSLRKRDIHEKP